MLANWIPTESLAALNEGFVVVIMLEAKEGEEDAVADIARRLTPPSMAGVRSVYSLETVDS
jgi:hypothetical protein